ncbi:MAG: hypothetical protein ACE365_01580 [Gammaproteobacteria bacterium]
MSTANKYLQALGVPDITLDDQGSVSELFKKHGLHTFYDAVNYLHSIKYGPIQNRADYTSILSEGRGTCSPKHALLFDLAKELGISLELYVGAILMTSQNTPLIKSVLEKYGLEGMLEAHTYTKFNARVIDITFPLRKAITEQYKPVDELKITPVFIGEEKEHWHRQEMEKYIKKNNIPYSVDELFDIRMECLGELFK